MALNIKDFDEMVDDTLDRIVNSGVGITNTSVGSVVRTLVESILSEMDVLNYNVMQAYVSKTVDEATGEDLDNIGSIFGLTRDSATSATGQVTFSVTEASVTDIAIEYNQIVSTRQNASGDFIEVMVTDEHAKLLAGQTSVTVNVKVVDPGVIYIPINTLVVMSTPIIGIAEVTNHSVITGGSNEQSDQDFRDEIKSALTNLGKGTISAIQGTLSEIDGVLDVVVLDMVSGVATVDVIVVTNIMPAPSALNTEILATINEVKAAGIKVNLIYPTVVTVNINVNTTGGSNTDIYNAILGYLNGLKIGNKFIINQMEKNILSALSDTTIDVTTVAPSANVTVTGTQIIRGGTITVNGVVQNA